MAMPGALMTDRRFAQLLRVHTPPVAAYAHATAPDSWTAEDAVQETFLRAWKYRDTYRAAGSFEGWLIRICRNCLIDLAAGSPAQPIADVPERAEHLDAVHDLYDLLGRLPVSQREVIALCGLLGYDYVGAAELLDVPIGTIRSRLHRARTAIAEQLAEAEGEMSA